MEKEFVPYELAVKLKALGFDESCFSYYEPNGNLKYVENHIVKDFPFLAKNSEWQDLVAAPIFSQAFRWFREKYGLFHSTNYQDDNSGPGCFDYEILDKRGKTQVEDDGPEFKTYEEAELACLIKLIEIAENDGPRLSDTDTLKYFHDKLKLASKIPFSRQTKD